MTDRNKDDRHSTAVQDHLDATAPTNSVEALPLAALLAEMQALYSVIPVAPPYADIHLATDEEVEDNFDNMPV